LQMECLIMGAVIDKIDDRRITCQIRIKI